MKKVMFVITSLFMMSVCFADSKSKKSKTTKFNMNVNIACRSYSSIGEPDEEKTYQWIKNKFGVSLKILKEYGDNWGPYEVRAILSENDNIDLIQMYPDIYPDIIEKDKDLFYPLEDLIKENCPNLSKHYSKYWSQIRSDDGKVYTLVRRGILDGQPEDTFYNTSAFWIQKRVLKEFGYPQIKTIDQYFNFLGAYYKKYPSTNNADTIPFSIISADWEAFNLWNPALFLSGNPNEGDGFVVKEGNSYRYQVLFNSNEMHEWLKYANKYYHRGLIDPDCFTDDKDEYYEKITQGRVLGMFIQGWEFMQQEYELKEKEAFEKTYVPLPIVFNESIKPHYRDRIIPDVDKGFAIPKTCKKDKAIKILKFFDQLMEEDNQKVLSWGILNEDYKIDKKGNCYYTEEQYINFTNKSIDETFYEWAPKYEGCFSDGTPSNSINWSYVVRKNANEADLEVFDAYKVNSYAELMDKNPPDNDPWYPLWQIKLLQVDNEVQQFINESEKLMRHYIPLMICSDEQKFEKIWNEYNDKMNQTPIESFQKVMQTALEERLKKAEQ